MTLRRKTVSTRRRNKVVWFGLIVVFATLAGIFANWRAPGLNLFAQDQLMRTRGSLAEPDDIVIVAIDEQSIARFGQFPWKRSIVAQAVDKLAAAGPRVIALDVLYPETTNDVDDKALSDAIKRAGNVVIGEQLIEDRTSPELSRSVWLRSLPGIEENAAGIGHVNVETESDGTARELLLRMADDDGNARWALALEAVRVGDSLKADNLTQTDRFVRVGTRKIPFDRIQSNLNLKSRDSASQLTTNEPLRMMIDYIGPSGSFAAQTVNFSDLLDGKVSPERFRGKYVLIGATAATLGDRIATPFVHTENIEGDQHGDLTPGVEILANSINTILRERFYRGVSDWTNALFAALLAFAVIFLTGMAEGRFEAAKQMAFLGALLVLVLLGSYLAFTRALIIPPLIPMLAAFVVATPLSLLRRSIAASGDLDERIGEVVAAQRRLLTDNEINSITPGESPNFIPHGLEWKAQTLGVLSHDLIARALFIDAALKSLDEGLLIADAEGRIIFANQSASRILSLSEKNLVGSDLYSRILEADSASTFSRLAPDGTQKQLIDENKAIECEIVIERDATRFYILRLSPVVKDENGSQHMLGTIAALSEITQHRELEKTKNDVIALVTHELRTPLTAIQGMSELLTDYEVEPEAKSKMISTINAEAKRLSRMVNQYLDITRLEFGAQKAHFTIVDAHKMIEQTLLLLQPLAAKQGIKFVRRFQKTPAYINADVELLSRSVTNIVANAIKYSLDNTSITVRTETSDESLKIIISDQGIGIPADHLSRIFEKFYRVPNQRATDVPGTGLGLALTKEIIELHKGRIVAESEPDTGTTFTIFLPLAS